MKIINTGIVPLSETLNSQATDNYKMNFDIVDDSETPQIVLKSFAGNAADFNAEYDGTIAKLYFRSKEIYAVENDTQAAEFGQSTVFAFYGLLQDKINNIH